MNSIIVKDNLGETNDWKFLRDDLVSIFAADDDRLNKHYENGEIETAFDEMAKDYLSDFTMSGFCVDEKDTVGDVINMIFALTALNFGHPYQWDNQPVRNAISSAYPSSFCTYPSIFMIDVSNMGDNYNEEFVKTLDNYFALMGYGHMDLIYGQRLVYIYKHQYANKVKDANNIVDHMSSKHVVKFEPYNFNMFLSREEPKTIANKKLVESILLRVLCIETAIATECRSTITDFDIVRTGSDDIDKEIMEFVDKYIETNKTITSKENHYTCQFTSLKETSIIHYTIKLEKQKDATIASIKL